MLRAPRRVRSLALIPWFIPPVVASSIWMVMLQPDRSPINQILRGLGLISINLKFLTDATPVLGILSLPMLAVSAVRIWTGLSFTTVMILAGLQSIPEVRINGDLERRVPHNLNISFQFVEGESLLMGMKGIAVSSGSACTSASLEPSYVLRALGRSDELAHSSIRFSIGRFTTEEEVDYAIKLLHEKIGKLRELSPLWEMFKEGIDLNTVQWAAH